VVPEIHVSYFTPRALSLAMRARGFEPKHEGRVAGWDQILRFKVLKNLGVRRISPLERCLPWSLIARLADARHGVSAHPVGRAV
jgi:hypothetical protein